MANGRQWTEEETVRTLALYLVTPFGRMHHRNPAVVRLAQELDRTADSIAMKLGNLAALDESLPRKGLANTTALDRRVWASFQADPGAVIEAYAQLNAPPLRDGELHGFGETQVPFGRGLDRVVQQNQRVGQSLFRDMILASYHGRCALTGIEDERLLTASHIVGWAEDERNRLNPGNGVCLNALHDRAFDRHLITFDEDYQMVVAPDVPENARQKLERVDTGRLSLPWRFLPDQTLLEMHRRHFSERVRSL